MDANTHQFVGYIEGPYFEEDDCWCDDCVEHVALLTLKELWKKFSDVPVNDKDEIEWDFLHFETGDSKFDVWNWFDERCPNGLAVDLMGKTTKTK